MGTNVDNAAMSSGDAASMYRSFAEQQQKDYQAAMTNLANLSHDTTKAIVDQGANMAAMMKQIATQNADNQYNNAKQMKAMTDLIQSLAKRTTQNAMNGSSDAWHSVTLYTQV
jgi:hypothetical protein